MRVTQAQVNNVTLDGCFESDALNFKAAGETFADAVDHVVHESAAQTVQCPSFSGVAIANDQHFTALHFHAGYLQSSGIAPV